MNFDNFIEEVAKKAQESNVEQEEDYLQDGLLFCGKCHTAKQCRISVLGKEHVVYCMCKCRAEQREKERIEQLKREKMLHIQRMRKLGFPDSEMENWRFERDDGANEKISKAARNYVENFSEMKKRGKGLLLFGKIGTGKSFISACIANALIDKGIPCLVTNFARLVNTIQETFEGRQKYIDSLNDFDLLVIDDLSSERDTEYMNEIIQNIIDSRYRSGLPLIITTNLTSDELKRPAEIRKQRIYSRLYEMCYPIEVEGKDRRRQKLKSDYDEIGTLLGINVAERNNIKE